MLARGIFHSGSIFNRDFTAQVLRKVGIHPIKAREAMRYKSGDSSQPLKTKLVMPDLSKPRDLLINELKDLYSAETQLVRALPKMAKAASTEKLQKAFITHLEETKVHAERIEQIMAELDESPRGKKCAAMEGLIEEGKELLQEEAEPAILDLALIGAAQKVEHYEIAGYGTARNLAALAGETKAAKILQQTLDEEGKTDKLLTSLAEKIGVDATAGAER